ncbi:MAG: two-component regulator propeller domain-containing protein, partial [Bacteroidales bacterium]
MTPGRFPIVRFDDHKEYDLIPFYARLIKCIILFFLLTGINVSNVFPQNNNIIFSHIDVNNGLSDNWVKCIYKDSKGFIWMGTNGGLNRFDGYNFKLFKRQVTDSISIADNAINSIAEDNEGNLWIGTRSGISVLDQESYTFKKINLPASP